MTRLWPEGELITVVEEGALPLSASPSRGDGGKVVLPGAFSWQGQHHEVSAVTRHWRVDLDWWREPVWRDYFKLVTTSGLLVIIYHNLISGKWYLQRLYD
jgi:hypothetical protein